MRTTGLCSARFCFSTCSFFSTKILHNLALHCSLSRTGWQTAVSSAVWSHCFFFKFCHSLQCDFPPVQALFLSISTKAKGEAEPLLLLWCGQQDLNLHESPHKNLNLTRLPISPCPLAFITISIFYAACQSFFPSFLSFL